MAARGRSERSRRESKRQEKPLVLIVCEGETEHRYFSDIKNRFRARWMEVHNPHCNDPKGLVRSARRKQQEFAHKGLHVEAWVVFDAESRAKQDSRGYSEAIELANKKGLHTANSSPSFEYWILLHYSPGVLVDDPADAKRELGKSGRILGYQKPNLPLDELWGIYLEGSPSKAARSRRDALALDGESVRLGRPVTFVDELVDRLAEIGKSSVIAKNQR